MPAQCVVSPLGSLSASGGCVCLVLLRTFISYESLSHRERRIPAREQVGQELVNSFLILKTEKLKGLSLGILNDGIKLKCDLPVRRRLPVNHL